MSHDDLEGIKNQIHSRINKINEVKDEESDNDKKKEDDEGQVI